MTMKSDKNNTSSKIDKDKQWLTVPIACFFGFLVFIVFPMILPKAWAATMPSFTESDMTGRWISVFMAFIFSTIVTNWLLKRQTSEQLETKKQEKIYEEKLKVYKEYLDLLGSIIDDGILKQDEEVKLRVLTASIAMHTDTERMKEICIAVRDVVLSMCAKNNQKIQDGLRKKLLYSKSEDDTLNENDERMRSDAMLKGLMSISDCFKEELYNKNDKKPNSLFNAMREPFADLFELANPDANNDKGQLSIDDDQSGNKPWDASRGHWELNLVKNHESKRLSLKPKGDYQYGEIYIRSWGMRCATVMYYLNEKGERVKDFVNEVKYWGFYYSNLRTVWDEWRNSLDDQEWNKDYDAYKQLNSDYAYPKEISDTDFFERYEKDPFFKERINMRLERLIGYMDKYHRRNMWKKEIVTCDDDIKKMMEEKSLLIVPHIQFLWCDYYTPARDGFIRLSLNEEIQKGSKLAGLVTLSRYNADQAFESLMDKIQGPLTNGKTKAQLLQEVNTNGYIYIDAFDFVMNEDSANIDEVQTAVRAKDTFETWHTRLRTTWQ